MCKNKYFFLHKKNNKIITDAAYMSTKTVVKMKFFSIWNTNIFLVEDSLHRYRLRLVSVTLL